MQALKDKDIKDDDAITSMAPVGTGRVIVGGARVRALLTELFYVIDPAGPIYGPAVTDRPEDLPLNSKLAVDDVVKAICDARRSYKDDQGTIESCYNITPVTWSPIMTVFYCQHPSMWGPGLSVPSVRGCFTGSIRGSSRGVGTKYKKLITGATSLTSALSNQNLRE